MNQQTLIDFDLAAAQAAKVRGMELAESRNIVHLDLARAIARDLAYKHGTVTADDVQAVLIEWGYEPLGKAAGRLFLPSEFEYTGERRKSKRVSNHAHENRVWRLK
jgi:hypothetical protein